ncbi:CFC_collapsed_G0047710.mRNA.1.CDS.1 [Saccharomyces cerevisiae]|nr:CFC_collapsed_G0047710.mRNA.1.CDS.1 [Saccharomyces cerevisiae]
MPENLAPLLASLSNQYTNCFLFFLGPHDINGCLPSILCIPRHFAAFPPPPLVLPAITDTILSLASPTDTELEHLLTALA